jgi:hypothetical protein
VNSILARQQVNGQVLGVRDTVYRSDAAQLPGLKPPRHLGADHVDHLHAVLTRAGIGAPWNPCLGQVAIGVAILVQLAKAGDVARDLFTPRNGRSMSSRTIAMIRSAY